MEKSKHTPGPWLCYAQTRGFSVESFNPDGGNPGICDVNGADEREAKGRGTNEANALLIAAAPELLAALETLVSWADKLPEDRNAYDFVQQARAAIKKAKGE